MIIFFKTKKELRLDFDDLHLTSRGAFHSPRDAQQLNVPASSRLRFEGHNSYAHAICVSKEDFSAKML
jgi:hypothetical protein